MSRLTDKVKAAVNKVTVKKTVAPKVEKEKANTACPNCENSGLSCAVCKNGRDDVV